VAPTISEALARARGILSSIDIESAAADADLLLAHSLHLRRIDLIIHRDRRLTEEEMASFGSLISRRERREPVAYITGEKEFYSRSFQVNRHVLIPRPETEILVEQALERAPRGATVFEIGVGSGAVICSILAERSDLRGIGNDISIDALGTARTNASDHGVSGRLKLFAGHTFEGLRGQMQVIVANPPYISEGDAFALDEEVRLHEPARALFGGKDGLDIVKEIINGAPDHLPPGGFLLMEAGIGQKEAVDSLVKGKEGLAVRTWKLDLAGIPRVVIMERIHG
jgi:release factor glutamine methyltransferase